MTPLAGASLSRAAFCPNGLPRRVVGATGFGSWARSGPPAGDHRAPTVRRARLRAIHGPGRLPNRRLGEIVTGDEDLGQELDPVGESGDLLTGGRPGTPP